MKIFFHADDFGISLDESREILECYEKGRLNSLSIIVNSPQAADCYRLIEEKVNNGELRCVLHLNFLEGKCAAERGPETLSHLVDQTGFFDRSFFSVLSGSLLPERKELKEELKREIRAQMRLYIEMTGSHEINLDSHQHYHMIPLVWRSLWEVAESEGYRIRCLRIPSDPLLPVVKCGLVFRVPLINYVKWIVLGICRRYCLRHCGIRQSLTVSPVFFGIPFTCRMEKEIVEAMLKEYTGIAEQNDTDLELMFHPGSIRDPGQMLDGRKKELVDFYTSGFRAREKKTLLQL